MSSAEAGYYGRFLHALENDVRSYSEEMGIDFKKMFENRNRSYSIYKQNYGDNDFLSSIYNEQNPNKMFQNAFDPNNPVAVETLKKNLSPQLHEEMQQASIREMGAPTPDVWSQAKFIKSYEEMGEANLKRYFSQKNYQKVRELYVASKATLAGEGAVGPVVQGGSKGGAGGMGSFVGLGSPMYAMLRGKPSTALKILGGEAASLPGAARVWLGKPANQFLTQQPVTSIPKILEMIKQLKQAASAVPRGVAALEPLAAPGGQENIQELIKRLVQSNRDKRDMTVRKKGGRP